MNLAFSNVLLWLQAQRVNKDSPIALMKCVKNATEIKGFQAAHVRNSIGVRFVLIHAHHWVGVSVSFLG